MRCTKYVFVVFTILGLRGASLAQVSRIELVTPTINQEATSIWRTINDLAFFEEQGYRVNLPVDPLIDSLIAKSKKGTFGNEDFPAIYSLLEQHAFDAKHYEQAKHKVAKQLDLINNMIIGIEHSKSEWDWDFQLFDRYQVVLTLYGTGGSYDPDTGMITLLTNENGGFMKYQNPAYTIIHEIVHMGIEYSIVRNYNLSHGLKERLVDTFVYLMFKEELPSYQIQRMGDTAIDDYLRKPEDLSELNAIVAEFVAK